MEHHHPWRDLRDRPHIIVQWANLPPGLSGVTDGTRIYLHHDLLQVERRCTLAHELAHIDAGDQYCQAPAIERQIRQKNARDLITMNRVIRAVQWTHHLDEAADELWVTPRVLSDYLHSLTDDECAQIQDAIRRKEA